PDCQTFAEDVVRGYANLEDCYRIALDWRGG
ncbi:MAG: (Fe-S)-binding protein, partial [Desulfobacterales bacterium]